MTKNINSFTIFTIISTHTLTWSVTDFTDRKIRNYSISTHTLTWSVTSVVLLMITARGISTHTLTWSVTDEG